MGSDGDHRERVIERVISDLVEPPGEYNSISKRAEAFTNIVIDLAEADIPLLPRRHHARDGVRLKMHRLP